MAVRDILICLDPTEAAENRLRLAAGIARARQARLAGVFLLSESIPGFDPAVGLGVAAPVGAAGIPEGIPVVGGPTPMPPGPSRAAALADIVEQRFRAELGPHQQTEDWHVFGSGEGDYLTRLAKTFDLVVCGQADPDYAVAGGLGAEELVLGCARPVLVVPYAGAFAAIGRRVLIAWDGSREAVRAVHDGLPLIEGAEAVAIAIADGDDNFAEWRPDFERLVAHLNRHGVRARMEQSVRGDLKIADLLLSRAADMGADLIVAGAYHHSPTREAWLGGVSRDLLDRMTVPVLMSH